MREEIKKIPTVQGILNGWTEKIISVIDKAYEDMVAQERIENAELFKKNFELRKEIKKLKANSLQGVNSE